MLCIDLFRHPDGYNVIRVTDRDGLFCSYAGYDQWPAHCLFAEYGIRI